MPIQALAAYAIWHERLHPSTPTWMWSGPVLFLAGWVVCLVASWKQWRYGRAPAARWIGVSSGCSLLCLAPYLTAGWLVRSEWSTAVESMLLLGAGGYG